MTTNAVVSQVVGPGQASLTENVLALADHIG